MSTSPLIKKVDQLTSEERGIIEKRIKITNKKPDVFSFINNQTDKTISVSPEMIYTVSNGTEFRDPYFDKAFDYECMLYSKELIAKKIKQRRLPDIMYYLALNDFIQPEQLKGIRFDGAYFIEIPDDSEQTLEEIGYLHGMLRINNIGLRETIKKYGIGGYALVYTTFEDAPLSHPIDKCDIKIRPFSEFTTRLQNMINELNTFTTNGNKE